MIKSMTGYGQGRAKVEGTVVNVEIRTVNHRFCDVTVKVPRALLSLETKIKKTVGERLKRGKIDLFITQEFTEGAAMVPTLNRSLAVAYVELFEEMRTAFAVDGGIPLSLLVAQKDVIVPKEAPIPEDEMSRCLEMALQQALEGVEQMRFAEGEATQKDVEGHLAAVEGLLDQVEQRAPQVPLEWQGKLVERLERLKKDFEYDPQRVAQEIAVFADRCDISEEVARFKSHLVQFQTLFADSEPVGRRMDFLLQEMNREVNTMGSKSNDAELTRLVVTIKAELEKIREQVQNVE
jgi:uncharacterized protein (TIGR00255 family)